MLRRKENQKLLLKKKSYERAVEDGELITIEMIQKLHQHILNKLQKRVDYYREHGTISIKAAFSFGKILCMYFFYGIGFFY